MKGIILSGGKGTRLYPSTQIISKQLLPVYDKPMVYYPLSTLMLAGIKEIALISSPKDLPMYKELLGDGKELGITIEYFVQEKPLGIAHSLIVCKDFIRNDKVCLILGDNIIHGNLKLHKIPEDFKDGALIFGYPVKDPERYGVIEFKENGKIKDIIEKPNRPPSNYAIPGIYFYDESASYRAENLQPSPRGELEITDLNRTYLIDDLLQIRLFGRGVAWFDTGTSKSLQEAGNYINSIQEVQRYKIACIEEIALRRNFITKSDFEHFLSLKPDSDYKSYLMEILSEISDRSQKHISDLQP